MKTKELLTLMIIMLVTTMTAQTNRLDSRALWASINGVKNASLGDYQTHTGKVLVTWRMLPSDDDNTSFDLYRTIGTGAEQLIASDIKATNYQDNSANKSSDNTYRLTYAGRNETIGTFTLKQAQVSNGLPYISIPLKDTKDVYANTDKIVYTANDVSVGDLDGDGEYEIVVKRLQSVKDANGNIISDGSGASYSQQDCLYAVIWDAYKLDGTFLWRIKGGPGIILGNSSAFAIADFDGDGCAEMAIRTCEGTVFGDGTAIGDTNGDGKIDYRTWGNLNSSSPGWGDHYNCAGPEFISVIDGKLRNFKQSGMRISNENNGFSIMIIWSINLVLFKPRHWQKNLTSPKCFSHSAMTSSAFASIYRHNIRSFAFGILDALFSTTVCRLRVIHTFVPFSTGLFSLICT